MADEKTDSACARDDEMLPEYDFSKMKELDRGRYAKKMRKGYTITVHKKSGSSETIFVPPDPAARARIEAEYQRLTLIDALRTLREKAGLTRAELASKMGVSLSRIARLENPDFDGQTVRDLHTVASALGMELEMRIVKPGKKRRVKAAGAA